MAGQARRAVLDRIPLVKSVFQCLKDVARLFSGDREKNLGRAVAVEIQGICFVGFVTQESVRLPRGLPEGEYDRIAVYLPMSYQLGGYTLYRVMQLLASQRTVSRPYTEPMLVPHPLVQVRLEPPLGRVLPTLARCLRSADKVYR